MNFFTSNEFNTILNDNNKVLDELFDSCENLENIINNYKIRSNKINIKNENLKKLQIEKNNKKEIINDFENNLNFIFKKITNTNQIKLIQNYLNINFINKILKCINCKNNYNENNNKENSCLFHKGKLKFYSCRTCGKDDYYNCCNSCKKCSQGCISDYHKPIFN